jgi:4,5-DOPA dioxygenase extradiol
MSIDMTRTPREHVEIGSMLRALRTQGVLIMGSGNIVHNLGAIAWGDDASPFDWAIEADKRITDLLLEGNHNALIDYHTLGSVVARAIPTPEHYLPLLYLLGLMERDEHISFPVVGIAHGSISMRSIRIG